MRIGTAYFADLVERFGGVHHALASYNAGPSPVSRWIAEKPGVARDEFIDDIPYPETQNYVKRILGTAEDYRRLYSQGGGRVVPGAPGTAAAPAPAPAKKAPATEASAAITGSSDADFARKTSSADFADYADSVTMRSIAIANPRDTGREAAGSET